MAMVKEAVKISVPKGINFERQFRAAEELASAKVGAPFRGRNQQFNCATGSQYVLSRGGVKTQRVDSLSPAHPQYSESYRGGVRSTQLNTTHPTTQGVVTNKIEDPLHQPVKGKDLYLQQQIYKKKNTVSDADLQKYIKGESNLTADDLYNPHDFIEHTAPIIWKGDKPHVLDIRRKANAIVPYHDYLAREMSASNKGRVHTSVASLS